MILREVSLNNAWEWSISNVSLLSTFMSWSWLASLLGKSATCPRNKSAHFRNICHNHAYCDDYIVSTQNRQSHQLKVTSYIWKKCIVINCESYFFEVVTETHVWIGIVCSVWQLFPTRPQGPRSDSFQNCYKHPCLCCIIVPTHFWEQHHSPVKH